MIDLDFLPDIDKPERRHSHGLAIKSCD